MSSPGHWADEHTQSDIRDGMHITWNACIPMSDGVVLRADIYRPMDESLPCPAIYSHGVYAKGLAYQEGYPMQWNKMVTDHPDILQGSTNLYQSWEVTDPERWVPHGYAVIRVDSRGAGWSPGQLNPMDAQETQDACECVEWIAQQSWCDGSVGMLGISYFATMAWRVAACAPRGLKAIIPWEGFMDLYRDSTRHGGILSEFAKRWAAIQAVTVQYGLGERAKTNSITGVSIAGPVSLSDEALADSRQDLYQLTLTREMDSDWWRQRSANPQDIHLPFLSCANWGGMGIHPRGNFLGFTQAPAQQKWLEVHGDTHWSLFSTDYGVQLQRRFFDHFLKGHANGWDQQRRVMLNIRHVDGSFTRRDEDEWPLARTQWQRQYLRLEDMALTPDVPEAAQTVFRGKGPGLRFRSNPMPAVTEVTGPMATKLFIQSSTADADIFVIVQVWDPQGRELTFQGALDPNTPISMGWLRASHRKLDLVRSTPWQPFHSHDDKQPVPAGEVVELDIEILPTCIVLPAGWRLGLQIKGCDYVYDGDVADFGQQFYYATRGTGGMTHEEPLDRPTDLFDNDITLHTGGRWASYLLTPIIP